MNADKRYRVECQGCGAVYEQTLKPADVGSSIGPVICGACGATAIRVWTVLRDNRAIGQARPATYTETCCRHSVNACERCEELGRTVTTTSAKLCGARVASTGHACERPCWHPGRHA
jgi:hypothetical protein